MRKSKAAKATVASLVTLIALAASVVTLIEAVAPDGDGGNESQNPANVDASNKNDLPPAGTESPAGSRTKPSGGAQATQSTADRPATTSQSNSAGHPDVDHISDGERICGPECPEQYVVKVARAGRFKRLLLSHDVVRFYGQFRGRLPTEVERAVLDAFETSCFVWHARAAHRTYYFFDAQPGTDAGVKWRIDASNADVAAAGIANAAFQVNEQELAYFSSAGSVTLSEALNLRCAE